MQDDCRFICMISSESSHGTVVAPYLVALGQVVGVQDGVEVVAGSDGAIALVIIARVQPPLQVPAHALERCRCNDTCATTSKKVLCAS